MMRKKFAKSKVDDAKMFKVLRCTSVEKMSQNPENRCEFLNILSFIQWKTQKLVDSFIILSCFSNHSTILKFLSNFFTLVKRSISSKFLKKSQIPSKNHFFTHNSRFSQTIFYFVVFHSKFSLFSSKLYKSIGSSNRKQAQKIQHKNDNPNFIGEKLMLNRRFHHFFSVLAQ